jgi:hypothetical protein
MDPGSDLVTWTEDDRRQLAELCRQHDRMMAEAREDERRRELEQEAAEAERAATENLAQEGPETGAKGSYMQRSASAAEAEPEPDWSGWERWMDGHLSNLRTEIFDTLTECLGEVIAELRREWERDIERMECRILRQMVGITTKNGEVTDRANDSQRADQDADVIGLPRKRPSDAA